MPIPPNTATDLLLPHASARCLSTSAAPRCPAARKTADDFGRRQFKISDKEKSFETAIIERYRRREVSVNNIGSAIITLVPEFCEKTKELGTAPLVLCLWVQLSDFMQRYKEFAAFSLGGFYPYFPIVAV